MTVHYSGALTNREKQVVDALVRGFSTRDIADKLGITPLTVSTYAKRIRMKLGVKSRAELTATVMGMR